MIASLTHLGWIAWSLVFQEGQTEAEESWWDESVIKIGESTIITPRNIATGLAILIAGYLAARLLSRFLSKKILSRFHVNEGTTEVVDTLVFYALLLVVLFTALSAANVPLTAFTLLGGAAAIGVGFGSQNLINNFISGLILLIERPINVGNLIEVGELYGTVERIGPRSARIRTGENVEIVVPNSTFLESNVINWTLSDPRVRVNVAVGVIYGSPTDEVARLLKQAVAEHSKVLKNPEPIVLFIDFGDNALGFQVHFWIEMRRMMDRRIVESDVRFKIDALFREAGLVIAFPQRDVHLDATRPIDVRIHHTEDEEEAPAT